MHSQPLPNIANYTCPKCGKLRFGFSMAQVLAIRNQGVQVFADPDVADGAAWDPGVTSTTCGLISLHFEKGVLDPADQLPQLLGILVTDQSAPDRGSHRLLRKITDQTAIGSTATDVAELGIAVKAGDQLSWRAVLFVETSAASIGAMVSMNGPAVSVVRFTTLEWTSGTVSLPGKASAWDSFSTQLTGPGASTVAYVTEGIAVFTADGTFVPRIKAETGGTCSVLLGSKIEYDLI